jgi:hypothetical protein
MIVGNDARRSLVGAWRLFLNRREGLRDFDVTVEGFWRSFGAVVFVAPIFVLGVLADERRALDAAGATGAVPEPAHLIEQTLALGIDWIALPIVLFLAAGPLGITRTYAGYIVVRNWSAVIAALPFGIVALLGLTGVIGDQLSAVLILAALVVVLRYNYIVARAALGASVGFAIGLVAFDFLLSLLIAEGVSRAFGVPLSP